MRKALLLTLLLIPLSLPHMASAKPKLLADSGKADMDIMAVANDEAISSYDVENRIKFIIATARLSNTPEMIARIRPQVIRTLIDERLQMQEAGLNDIKISDTDIKNAIASIEQDRGMPPGTIEHMLQGSRVPKQTFTQQVKAQLAWNKLLMRKVRPQIRVSDEEIDLAAQKMPQEAPSLKPGGVPQELKIAVIALPVDKPSREGEMRKLGEKLVREVHAGASFEEVSRQFSSSAATSGGKTETFWIKPQQLDPAVARALAGAGPGFVSEPVRTRVGFTIVKVYDARIKEVAAKPQEPLQKETEITFREILLRLKPDAKPREAEAMLQVGEEVAKHPGTCEDKGVAGITQPDDFAIEATVKKENLSSLSPALKALTATLKTGEISTPMASKDGIKLYMLCGKKEISGKPIDRDRVYAMLVQEKLELEAQKYLRNLRREAFVDIR